MPLAQVNRHRKSFCDALRGVLRQRHAVVHRRAFDWHERDDIDSAHPRMFARMRSQIDQADRGVKQREHGGFERIGIAGHGDDRAVMRRIGGEIQQARTGHTANGRRDCRQRFPARRPSLMFGTHSMIATDNGSRLRPGLRGETIWLIH